MSASIRQMLIPTSSYSIKSPYSMTPKGIVFHNTAGTSSAMAEASYMVGNSLYSSMHLYVDESEAVQTLAFNRNAWHATDGSNGYANRNLIGLEVCRSRSALATFKQAEENAVEICAKVLLQLGLPANSATIRWHSEFTATACPHRTAELGGRNRIIMAVQAKMNALGGENSEGGEIMRMSTKPVAMKLGPMSGGDLTTMKALLGSLQIGCAESGGYISTTAISVGDQNTVLQKAEALGIGFEPLVALGVPQADYDKEVAARKAAETKVANAQKALA